MNDPRWGDVRAPRPAPPGREEAARAPAADLRTGRRIPRRRSGQGAVPVLPAVHYTMGGITADGKTAAPLPGLYSVGECSSVGIHGANRLGSNSLTELIVFGKVAGVEAAAYSRRRSPHGNDATLQQAGRGGAARVPCRSSARRDGNERIATLRREMAKSMEDGCGIYRTAADHAGHLRQARRAEAALPARAGRRPLQGLEHRLAARHRTRLPARRGAGDGAFGPQPPRVARLAPAAGRLRGARRRELPEALAGALRRRRRAAHRLRPGEDHDLARPARAPTARPARRRTARRRRRLHA